MRRADGKIDMCHDRLKVEIIRFKISNVRFLKYGDGTMNAMQISVNNCCYSFHLDTANRYHVMLAWEPREHWGHSYGEDDISSNV